MSRKPPKMPSRRSTNLSLRCRESINSRLRLRLKVNLKRLQKSLLPPLQQQQIPSSASANEETSPPLRVCFNVI